MKNMKMAVKINLIIISILVIGFICLWFTVNRRMTEVMEQSIVRQLDNSVETQAEIVRNYVDQAAAYLIGYAQAPVMTSALSDVSDDSELMKLQEYTDAYAGVGNNLENIYVADYDSKVIASYERGPIGVTLREGDSLKQLRDAISGGLYNAGIMASKSTDAQIISMCYPVDDREGRHLGYVGETIYAGELRDTLNELPRQEGSNYYLLDSISKSYIFCPEDEMIGTSVENTDILNIMDRAADAKDHAQTFLYVDSTTGEKMISIICYMEEYDWVLTVLTEWDVAFAPVQTLSVTLAVLCLVLLVIISAVVWISVSAAARAIGREAAVIQQFGTLNFAGRQELEHYCGRKDEVGMIADATKVLVDAMYYIVVDLKEKSEQLQKTASAMRENSAAVSEAVKSVETAMQEIANGAGSQADETNNASKRVVQIGNQIAAVKEKSLQLSDIAAQINTSGAEALHTLQILVGINERVQVAAEQINSQTLNTNESVLKIRDAAQLITSIAEETNLLSLNASIEAARAGEQGSGFAVVAGQIKKLAEQSNDSAKDIDEIIDDLLQESSCAVQTMNEVREIVQEQNEHLEDTKECFAKVNHNVDVMQEEISNIEYTISDMDEERSSVVDAVQNLTAIAEENASGSEESLSETEAVNKMTQNVAEAAKALEQLAYEFEKDISIFQL